MFHPYGRVLKGSITYPKLPSANSPYIATFVFRLGLRSWVGEVGRNIVKERRGGPGGKEWYREVSDEFRGRSQLTRLGNGAYPSSLNIYQSFRNCRMGCEQAV